MYAAIGEKTHTRSTREEKSSSYAEPTKKSFTEGCVSQNFSKHAKETVWEGVVKRKKDFSMGSWERRDALQCGDGSNRYSRKKRKET